MTNQEILRHIDHTLLSPTATWAQVQQLCEEAIRHQMASVCVPPCYVRPIHTTYGDQVRICTVAGFPLGYCAAEGKLAEAAAAIADGAVEVDMVVNLTHVKNGYFDAITREISAMKDAVGQHILKVIVETCYLTEPEKTILCGCVTDGGGDFIKTSTGFGPAGATLEDVRLFQAHVGPHVRIKAAGGIRTRADMEAYLAAGCSRLGTSGALKALELV